MRHFNKRIIVTSNIKIAKKHMLPQVAAPKKLFKEIAVILNFHQKIFWGSSTWLIMPTFQNLKHIKSIELNSHLN